MGRTLALVSDSCRQACSLVGLAQQLADSPGPPPRLLPCPVGASEEGPPAVYPPPRPGGKPAAASSACTGDGSSGKGGGGLAARGDGGVALSEAAAPLLLPANFGEVAGAVVVVAVDPAAGSRTDRDPPSGALLLATAGPGGALPAAELAFATCKISRICSALVSACARPTKQTHRTLIGLCARRWMETARIARERGYGALRRGISAGRHIIFYIMRNPAISVHAGVVVLVEEKAHLRRESLTVRDQQGLRRSVGLSVGSRQADITRPLSASRLRTFASLEHNRNSQFRTITEHPIYTNPPSSPPPPSPGIPCVLLWVWSRCAALPPAPTACTCPVASQHVASMSGT